MQTFLIASVNLSFIEKELKNITKDLQVSAVNWIKINPQITIGISDVRKISHTITLKPYGGGDRVIIIRSIEKTTTEAGNALLKILEEPPPNNLIILVTDNMNKLLPTIISRCQIISDNKIEDKSFDERETKKLLRQILTSSAGERILLSQKRANSREEAIGLLNNLLLTLEKLLHQPDQEISLSPKEIAVLLSKVSAALKYLERYINFKATIDVLFLGFPKKDENLS